MIFTTELERDIYYKKLHYRKYLTRRRNSLSKREIIENSNQIFNKIIKMEQYKAIDHLIIYCGKEKEVQTEKIIKYSLLKNKKVIVPITNTEKRILEFSEITNYDKDLVVSTFDILEPKKNLIKPIEISKVDLIIVPGLGFDKYGGRIGYGYGYFDKFLNSLDRHIPTFGLAFELQIVEILPMSRHDVHIDYIITNNRIINCNKEI